MLAIVLKKVKSVNEKEYERDLYEDSDEEESENEKINKQTKMGARISRRNICEIRKKVKDEKKEEKINSLNMLLRSVEFEAKPTWY